jgi:hypothetical protein
MAHSVGTTSSRRQVPDIPRGTWTQQASFPNQVLLLGSHANFRRISSHLVEESQRRVTEGAEPGDSLDLLLLFRRWKSAMKSHEAYEEGKLYPYLERTFDLTTDSLRSGHKALGAADTQVVDAYESGTSIDVAAAFAEHEKILLPHLLLEEDLVIPCLLSLSGAEFRATFG